MSRHSRNETVKIGDKSYSVETYLDEASWERLVNFTEETIGQTDDKLSPDRRLLLAWLNLAYAVEASQDKLLKLLDDFKEEEE